MGLLFSGCQSDGCCGGQVNPEVTYTQLADTPWSNAIDHNNLSAIKLLYNDDPSLLDSTLNLAGETAIHIAVVKHRILLLQFLMEKNADINVRTKNGHTPLHCAVEIDAVSAVKKLLSAGATIGVKDKLGRTVMDLPKAKKQPLSKILRNHCSHLSISDHESSLLHQESMAFSAPDTDRMGSTSFLIRSRTNMGEIEVDEVPRPPFVNDPSAAARTVFGMRVGVDLHEVAYFLQCVKDRKKLWNIFIDKDTAYIGDKTERGSAKFAKLTYGIVYTALRKKYGKSAQSPPLDTIKELTKKMRKMYISESGESGSWCLQLNDFVNDFHYSLYQMSLQHTSNTTDCGSVSPEAQLGTVSVTPDISTHQSLM